MQFVTFFKIQQASFLTSLVHSFSLYAKTGGLTKLNIINRVNNDIGVPVMILYEMYIGD